MKSAVPLPLDKVFDWFLTTLLHLFDEFLLVFFKTSKSNCKNCGRQRYQFSECEYGAWKLCLSIIVLAFWFAIWNESHQKVVKKMLIRCSKLVQNFVKWRLCDLNLRSFCLFFFCVCATNFILQLHLNVLFIFSVSPGASTKHSYENLPDKSKGITLLSVVLNVDYSWISSCDPLLQATSSPRQTPWCMLLLELCNSKPL